MTGHDGRDGDRTRSATLVRFEGHLATAALRRVATHPTRRVLWFVVGSLAVAAIAVDIATSGNVSRNVGAWSPTPLTFVLASAAIVAIAALAGTLTPLTYGTRAADRVWWRYAGVGTHAGRRATTAILAVRATVYVAWGALPIGVLFALVAPDRWVAIVALAASMLVLAPLSVVVAALTARGITARRDAPGPESGVDAARSTPAAAEDAYGAPPAPARSAARVPRGLLAARWLYARRHGAAPIPYAGFVSGVVVGFIAPRVAAGAGGQLVSTVIVAGGLAIVLDGAIRGTTAPAELRSPWWRSAIGTSPRAMIAWALAGTLPFAVTASGAVLGLGLAMHALALAVAAVPAIVLAPVALRLLVFGVDVLFAASADRRGVAAALRVALVVAATTGVVTAAFAVGARGGLLASIGTFTVLLAALVAASAWWCARRLPSAVV